MKDHGQGKEERDQAKLKKDRILAGDRSSARVRIVVRKYGEIAWQGWLDSSETLPVYGSAHSSQEGEFSITLKRKLECPL